ncbi:MAG: hypothetical protein R8P61_36590 [Bacteroidia bacterium]|nr:hypothetical protein [Bacteroidia bacterium]
MKISCACGSLIIDSTDGHSTKAHVLPDKLWNAFWTAVDDAIESPQKGKKAQEAKCMDLRRKFSFRFAYECNNCGRLYLYDQENQLQEYLPATQSYQKILNHKS